MQEPNKSHELNQIFVMEAELRAQAQDRQTPSSSEKRLSRGAYNLLVFAIILLILVALALLLSFLR